MTPRTLAALSASLLLAGGGVAKAQGMMGTMSSDPSSAPAGTYNVDKAHASVSMQIFHMGLSHYALRFKSIEAHYSYDPKSPAASQLSVIIDPKSIETFDPKFNEEIATKFFDAGKYPTITFVSTQITPQDGGRGKVVGKLTLHGVTKPVTLDVIYNGARMKMMGQDRMGFSALTTIKRSDFGVAGGMPASVLGDDIPVMIEAEFVRAAS